MRIWVTPLLIFLFSLELFSQSSPIVLAGGTLIDVTNYGYRINDNPNAMVVFQNGKILYAGCYDKHEIPEDAIIINTKNKFLLPGLMDGFSSLNSQRQADAQLYFGVTTICAGIPGDTRRGEIMMNANPSPRIKRMYALVNWGESEDHPYITQEEIDRTSAEIDDLDSLSKAGFSSVFLHHRFPAVLYDKLMEKCRQLQLNTVGEMQYASYREGMQKGVNSFVHTDRFTLEAAPVEIRDSCIHFPYSGCNSFVNWYMDLPARKNDVGLWQYARDISKSKTALMPTLALIYAMFKDHENLWKIKGASILDSGEIFLPMDPLTGHWRDEDWWAPAATADTTIAAIYVHAGCHFLTGTGADAFGSMPGIAEHIEMQMLHQLGLTNRQALAAATNNFSIFFNWTDRGLLDAGRLADILVLNKNPVEDLENLKSINRLFLNGTEIDRDALLKKNNQLSN